MMPDVIISDVGLPDEDGYKLMQRLALRDPLQGGDIPVIAVTAYGRPEDQRARWPRASVCISRNR